MKITKVILSLLLVASGVVAVAQEGEPMSDAIVIDGGTVHPVSGASFVGRVVVEDGRITAVGADAMAPEGAAVIDATGQHVYPGMIDALTQVGMIEVNSVPQRTTRPRWVPTTPIFRPSPRSIRRVKSFR